MTVKKEYRNQGVDGIILNYLLEYAKKLGFSEIALGVDIDNVTAMYLYNKKGFNTVVFEGEDEYVKYQKLLKIF